MNARRGGVWLGIAWAVGTGLLGMALSVIGGVSETIAWYLALRKPWFQPPDWLFGPAWGVIFVLAAWAFWRAWRAPGRAGLVTAYAVNGVLNAAWTGLFFGLRRPDVALAEVGPLWISVLVLVAMAWRRDALAGWLLVPYLLWVAFAALLNWEICRLNGYLG